MSRVNFKKGTFTTKNKRLAKALVDSPHNQQNKLLKTYTEGKQDAASYKKLLGIKTKKYSKSEESLQMMVSTFLKLKYPHVVFTSESSGLRLTIGQSVKAKKMRFDRGLPDMIILHPSKGYHGMCLELKNKSPFKKDGTLLSDSHLQEQDDLLKELRHLGYYAEFAVGFDDAKKKIDSYMLFLKFQIGDKVYWISKQNNIKSEYTITAISDQMALIDGHVLAWVPLDELRLKK